MPLFPISRGNERESQGQSGVSTPLDQDLAQARGGAAGNYQARSSPQGGAAGGRPIGEVSSPSGQRSCPGPAFPGDRAF